MKSAEMLYLSQEDVLAAGGLEMSLAVATMEEVTPVLFKLADHHVVC